MIIPSSHAVVLILLILGMLGYGLWANTFKATGGKWRFELYYFDFAFGVLLAATILALTFGRLGFDGFSFEDDLRLAGKRQDLFAFVGGMLFNLGNMLLLAGVSVTGMAVAFPAGMGVSLIMGSVWSLVLNQGRNPVFMIIGAVAIAAGIVLDILAFKKWSADKLKSQQADPAAKPRKRKTSFKGLLLSMFGGVLLGSFAPLVGLSRVGENGLGPYSVGFVFALGVLFSTFIFNLFFMNLPVQGSPVEIGDYFRARMSRHALGLLGGAAWYVGDAAGLVAGRADAAARPSGPIFYALAQGGFVIAALCGLFLWREFEGAQTDVKIRLGLMLFLMVAGLGFFTAALLPH